MKKLIFFLISCLCIVDVSAATEKFYGGKKIPEMYITKIDEYGNITNKQGGFIRRVSDDVFVYCLEPFVDLSPETNYKVFEDNFLEELGISKTVWEEISLIAYYGYMYEGHTEDYWYYITQMLIWMEIAPDAEFYFTDALGGPINEVKYQSEIKEIKNLVKKHKMLPNITDISILYGESITLEDTNKVLSNYSIESSNNLININGNNLEINASMLGSYNIKLKRVSSNYDVLPFVYIDEESQKVMSCGNLPDIIFEFNITIKPCKLIVSKKDAATLENINMSNIKFLLYDSFGNLVDSTFTNEEGIALFNNLKTGTYYLKEDKNQIIPGYNINEDVIKVEIKNATTNVDFYNSQVKGQIKIVKYQEVIEDNTLVQHLAKGIEFGLFDCNKNLIKTGLTNENGEIIFDNLDIGKYYIKELSVQDEYILNDDFLEVTVKITEDNVGSSEVIKVHNELKKGYIKVIKYKELEDKEIVLAKGIEIGLFDKDKNLIDVGITNEFGEVIFKLACGKYYVKELSELVEYEYDDTFYKVIVKENLEEEINIVNYLKKGKLIINKVGDNFIPLEGVLFNIYNENNELVYSGLTNESGLLEVNDLILGSYYIKEMKASSGYQILNDKIYFNILENEEVITINITNERISVKVPNTGMYLEEIILFIDKKRLKLA